MHRQGEDTSSQSSDSYGWLNGCLRWPSLLTFLIVDVALAATVLGLTISSSKNDGFVTIPSRNASSSSSSAQQSTGAEAFNAPWDLGVLWTSLPSFVFSIFGAYWAWIAGSLAERQPYVELRNPNGAPARTSVLLDYRVTASIWRWWGAFRKKHYMVGTTTLLSVFLTYAVAPFAARLFVPQVVAVSGELPVVFNQALNQDNLNSSLDWRPVLDTVAASLIHQGSRVAWTDDEHAFRPFSTNSKLAPGAAIAANTTAYSAYLNCELIEDYTITSDELSDGWEVEISGNDRGCGFKQSFGVASTQEIYFKTTVTLDCSAQAYFSRFVFTAATFSSSARNKLSDISVISCASGYRQVAGTLKVLPSASSPAIQSFAEEGERDMTRPKLWRVIEQGMLGPTSFNPQAKWSTSDMGTLILYYAQKSSTPFASETLINAISTVFTSIYLNAISIHGFDTLAQPETSTGAVFNPTTRLFVVPWVAYIIIAFMVITLCSIIFVYLRLKGNPSILSEEPQGLLSTAGILDQSQLLFIASNIRHEIGSPEGTRERGKGRLEVKDRKWGAVKDAQGNWVIRCIEDMETGPTEHLLAPAHQSPKHFHVMQ